MEFAGGGGHSLLWPKVTTFLNCINIYHSDHLFRYGLNFASEGGNSLLWPEATTFFNHMGSYSRPETNIVVYGMRPHGLISHKSRLPPGQKVTIITVISTCQMTICNVIFQNI